MKKVIVGFLLIGSLLCTSTSFAGFFGDIVSTGEPELHVCTSGECGLDEGAALVKSGLQDIETERTASQYIQDVIRYTLTFLSIVAVIYIIYSGFQLLTGSGDEEKMKKSKNIIVYVIIGIILIWLAFPITTFLINTILNAPSQ